MNRKPSPKTTEQRVYEALSEVTPKPISQLCEETGLSYGTVREYLTKLKAERITDTGPNRYLRPERPGLGALSLLQVWRHERTRIGARVSLLTITSGADPVWLADEFLELGRQLTEIGTAIDRVKMDPDWFQRLGGHFWLSDEKGRMQ